MSLKVIFLGEIVGRAGIQSVKNGLKELREEFGADYVIANGEGATNGFGLGAAHAVQLSKCGIGLLTGGEKIYYKVDMVDFFPKCNFVLRPANFPNSAPGKAYRTLTIADRKVAVVNYISTSGFNRCAGANPFTQSDFLLSKLRDEVDTVLVQFHCATTAEAATFGHFLDGKAAAVIGTHGKVMTADAQILPGGTAYISDNGRCGSFMSVGGLDKDTEVRKFLTALPLRSKEAWDGTELQGVCVEIGEGNTALSITPFRRPVKTQKPEPKEKMA